MSKQGTCGNLYPTCGPLAVALVVCQDGDEMRMCKGCLDNWLDSADDAEYLEPAAWFWLDGSPSAPSPEDWTAALRAPRNREAVAAALRREARCNPQWLRDFLAREQRIMGHRAPV
ncbi:hypothetical protein [Streptomyces niveus]|uniref:hypothetical protein n=1 Tax=Streptomyces niveus TaxID=193462 RepID=UPI00084C2361|nr:hypothetical protein [Streptomyces niveus]